MIEQESISQMKDMLNLDEFQEFVQTLYQSQYIDIYAHDANAKIAQYGGHLLSNIGKFVQIYQDTELQINHSLNVSKEHVIIIISKHAKNIYSLDIAKTLSRRHIPFTVITGYEKNALSQYTSSVIHTPFHPTSQKPNEIIFYTSLKYIFDMIYNVLFSKSYEKNLKYEELYNQIFFKNL